LPEAGALAGKGSTEVQITSDGALEFRTDAWQRTVRLAGSGAKLTIQQTPPLPPETLQTGKTGDLSFHVTRDAATSSSYTIERVAER